MNPRVALLLSGTVLSSCIMVPVPHDRPVSPVFYGQVRDEATGLPVKGATLRVFAYVNGAEGPTATAQTDESGHFEVGAVERSNSYTVLLLAPAEGQCSGTLVVSHPEYKVRFVEVSEFRSANVNGVCTGLKVKRDVSLKRQ